jgi:single-strand DNA-binding protein
VIFKSEEEKYLGIKNKWIYFVLLSACCIFVRYNKKRTIMSVNKVILIGNVGREPNVRYVDRDVAVASLSLATSDRAYTLPNGTQVPERTEWHNLVFWRGLAQTVEKYVHKGDKLYVEGSIHSRSYDDQNGVRRTVVEIWVDNMEMLSRQQQPAGQPAAQPAQPTAQQSTPDGQVPF